jgi:hypothetical protein
MLSVYCLLVYLLPILILNSIISSYILEMCILSDHFNILPSQLQLTKVFQKNEGILIQRDFTAKQDQNRMGVCRYILRFRVEQKNLQVSCYSADTVVVKE